MNLIKAYPEVRYQEVLGMGGALTEAAAYTYSRMSDEKKKELIGLYFGERKAGIISAARMFKAVILH